MPVRILYMIREAFNVALPKTQMKKYEEFERKKLRKIHDELIRCEKDPDINQIIKGILSDID